MSDYESVSRLEITAESPSDCDEFPPVESDSTGDDNGNTGPAASITFHEYGSGNLLCRFFIQCGAFDTPNLPPIEFLANGIVEDENICRVFTPQAGDIFFQKKHLSDYAVGSQAWLFNPLHASETGSVWIYLPDFSGTYSRKIPHPVHADTFLAHRLRSMEPCWVKGNTWDKYRRSYELALKKKPS